MNTSLTQTLKKFNAGDKLSLAQLKFLNKHLWGAFKKATTEEDKDRWKKKIDEVQEEIDYWIEIEKIHPFASFEKYSR